MTVGGTLQPFFVFSPSYTSSSTALLSLIIAKRMSQVEEEKLESNNIPLESQSAGKEAANAGKLSVHGKEKRNEYVQ